MYISTEGSSQCPELPSPPWFPFELTPVDVHYRLLFRKLASLGAKCIHNRLQTVSIQLKTSIALEIVSTPVFIRDACNATLPL